MGTERISRVTVRNPSERPQLVIFEPWADEYTLAPGAAFTFEASSPLEGWLTVEYQDQDVIVSGILVWGAFTMQRVSSLIPLTFAFPISERPDRKIQVRLSNKRLKLAARVD